MLENRIGKRFCVCIWCWWDQYRNTAHNSGAQHQKPIEKLKKKLILKEARAKSDLTYQKNYKGINVPPYTVSIGQ